MRRPHRTLLHRLRRRGNALGKRLPPRTRRTVRRTLRGFGFLSRITGRLQATPPNGVLIRRFRRAQPEIIDHFDCWQVQSELADSACGILIDAGIKVVRIERPGRILLAVPASKRADVLTALREAPSAARWWLCGDDAHPRRLDEAASRTVKGDDLALFRVLAGPGGHSVGAEDASVRLQFWRSTSSGVPRTDGGRFEKGTWLAPTRNGVAPYLTPAMWRAAQARSDRRFSADGKPYLLELNEPVDIIYTWVDGSDPAWRQRRQAVQQPADGLSADALDPSRAIDRGELRYSLRSVSMYASWVRRIWLITDGQVPDWLVDHPQLTVVDHREIFTDHTALPTFNSHAIESQLHHVPGLAEHFLYLNDDVFFGRPVRPELFFHGNGIAKFMISPVAIDRDPVPGHLNGAMHAARQNREFLEQTFGRTVTHRLQHVPHAHTKRSLQLLEERHPCLISNVAHSRFRGAEDVSIASDLGHYFAHAIGDAATGSLAFRYVDIGSPLAQEHFDHLLDARDQDCFCLNDVGGYTEPVDEAAVIDFMSRYFPVPSPFERVSPEGSLR